MAHRFWVTDLLSQRENDGFALTPGRIMQGTGPRFHGSKAAWWNERPAKTRRNTQYATHRGSGAVSFITERSQRVIVKVMPTKSQSRSSDSWYKHGVYLQRAGASGDGRGLGFDGERDDFSLSKTLAHWQRERDRHLFKIIVSPEQSDRLNLRQYARMLMRELQQDLGTTLQWAGIAHYNTDHPHLHIAVRGRDEHGAQLLIEREYLQRGLKGRAQDVATQMLGLRTAHEIARSREKAVTGRTWTFLDTQIRQELGNARMITDRHLTAHERGRLETLERRGLAWEEDDTWEVSKTWERLRMVDDTTPAAQDRPRTTAQERRQPHEKGCNHNRERGQQHEQEREDERQRIIRIDELEHDLGWSR